MTDDNIEAAWDAVFDALPAGWAVGRPSYYPERREWQQYAFDSFEVAKVGARSREWTAIGATEVECLREMARCPREIERGSGADVTAVHQANLGLGLGLLSFVLWPFAYAWLLAPGSNPDWFRILIPVAEWGALICAVAAIWFGVGARRAGVASRAARWAPRLGLATIGLYVLAFLAVAATHR